MEAKALFQLPLEAPKFWKQGGFSETAIWNVKCQGDIRIRRKKGQWLRRKEIRHVKFPSARKIEIFP